MSRRPQRKATVTIPLRVRVSTPAVGDQAVGDPAAQGFAGPKDEIWQRGEEAGTQDGQVTHGHQVVGQPGDKQVPVVVEAKETETDTDQVAISQAGDAVLAVDRGPMMAGRAR